MVECQLPKLKVASSSLVARSKNSVSGQLAFELSHQMLLEENARKKD